MRKTLVIILSLFSLSYGWVRKADLPCIREYGLGISLGPRGYYILGVGSSPSQGPNGFLWQYNQAGDSWTQLSLSPSTTFNQRAFSFEFTIGSKIFVSTGTDEINIPTSTDYRDTWQYDTLTGAWTQMANFGGGFREGCSSFSLNGKGYAGLGVYVQISFPNYTFFNDWWEYDPVLNTWTQKNNFPGAARSGAGSVTNNNLGYISMGASFSQYTDVWCYNPVNDSWGLKSPFPTSNGAGFAFELSQTSFFIYGNNQSAYLEFWKYDINADAWAQLPNIPFSSRGRYFSFSINGKGYLGGGIDTSNSIIGEFWEYSDSLLTSSHSSPSENSFAVYPNPFSDKFFVDSKTNTASEFELFDVSGKKVLMQTITSPHFTVSCNGLPARIYFYKISSR